MRIGYLTYGLDRNPTGIGRYAVELLRAFQALPEPPEIILLTTERSDNYDLWSKFEHHSLSGCHLLPSLLTIGNLALSNAIRKYDLQIVHDVNGIAPFAGPAFRAGRLVTIFDTFGLVEPKTHNRLDTLRYRWLLPHTLKKADAILTISQHSCQDIQKYLHIPSAKLKTIYCGIEAQFRPVLDESVRQVVLDRYNIPSPYLLYVGSLNARKNIAGLLEAFAIVLERYPNITLVIGGKRQWKASGIEATLKQLSLAEKVHFTGYIADQDLPALYSAAEAFVFPSFYEGFGLPPLEAMACGTPVITSNLSSLPEVVGQAALMVDPYDIKSLAAAIERILSDQPLRKDLQQRGLAQAAKFNWQITARQTLNIYKQVLLDRTS